MENITTQKEILDELKKIREEIQNDFIDNLLSNVKWLQEKAIVKSYEPTQHERDVFNEIRQIINNMNNWF